MDDKKDFNKKNVEKIKRSIMAVLALICAVPVIFCLYLTYKMNSLEGKIETLSYKISEAEAETAMPEEKDLAKLDEEAYGELGVSTTAHNQTLMEDGEADIEEETDYISNGRKVYLTFDDGPSIYTDEILDILDEKGVKATFFCVYTDDEALWHSYNRIADEGHTLAMHSYSHVYDTVYASEEAFIQDVEGIHDFLYEQTGVDCKFYRFPGGSSNTVSKVDIQTLMGYLYREGITYFDWNSLSGDAVDASLTPEQLNDNIMGYVRNNGGDSIILMHDLKNAYATVEALPELIDTLKEEGYEICAIDENTAPVQHVSYKGTGLSK